MIRLRLLSRPGCHLCDRMRDEVDAILAGEDRQWEIVNVDADVELARRYGEEIPVLFVNDRLFAKVRLPRLASRIRLRRAAGLAG
ncbi:MAG TPA: glutaredoxin family protein [Thermoanaerobaculia bacterium]